MSNFLKKSGSLTLAALMITKFICAGEPIENNNAEPCQSEEPPRRALPAPFPSPPFPSGEYQGYPLVGVPPSDTVYPLMESIYKTPWGDAIKKSRVQAYGWFNGSVNVSTLQTFKYARSPIGLSQILLNWINLYFVWKGRLTQCKLSISTLGFARLFYTESIIAI